MYYSNKNPTKNRKNMNQSGIRTIPKNETVLAQDQKPKQETVLIRVPYSTYR